MVLDHFTAPIVTSVQPPQPQAQPQPRAQAQGHGHGHGPRDPKDPSTNEKPDPNIPDHRLNVNRPCIYERRLPGNAYITAHVQRLQHGYYSTAAVSDRDIDYVDFLAVSFVFHSPDTRNHRFRAATIRASLHYSNGSSSSCRDRDSSSKPRHHRVYQNHPRFLMHAPHFLHGSLSPESLQWNYSLAGSLGIAQLPLIASLSPAAGLNGRFNRYEMMRIQGSVRSADGIPASQIVWTLEENTLQRSGLPREFTFAMLVAKPGPESRVQFVLEVEPVLQSWFGVYPGWWVALVKKYRATRRKRGVDFRVSVGQRFGSESRSEARPLLSRRGFNFATLGAGLDEYASFWGKSVPPSAANPPDNPDNPNPPPPPPPPNDNDPPPAMPLPIPVPMPMPHPGQDGPPAIYPMPIPVPMPGGYGNGAEQWPGRGQRDRELERELGREIDRERGFSQRQYRPQFQYHSQSQPSRARGRGDEQSRSAGIHAHPDLRVPARTSSARQDAGGGQGQRNRSRSRHGSHYPRQSR